MLFINLDLITELIGYSIHDCNKENKLLYYDQISNTTLEEDITFTAKENAILSDFCELEIYKASILGKNAKENIRSIYHFSIEEEKEFFTKLFVRDYLSEKENRKELLLVDYLSETKLFSTVALDEAENRLSALQLFKDFASPELKNDKDFAKVILQLDGTYILAMGDIVKDSPTIMEVAIKNDKTPTIESFINSNSKLLTNSDLAIAYFKKLKENNNMLTDSIYENIFKQENGEYPKTVFKHNEQSSWMEDSNFLPRLAKISNGFTDLISSGEIGPLSSKDKAKQYIKNNKQEQ